MVLQIGLMFFMQGLSLDFGVKYDLDVLFSQFFGEIRPKEIKVSACIETKCVLELLYGIKPSLFVFNILTLNVH